MATQKSGASAKESGKKDQLVLLGRQSRYDIIFDSGASHHMTGDITLLTNMIKIAPCPIGLPNGGVTWATSHGTMNFGGKLVLHNVFYASDLTITLISIIKRYCQLRYIYKKVLCDRGPSFEVFDWCG